MDDKNAKTTPPEAPQAQAAKPKQPSYGRSENFGSPGGDEPPASTDPGSGTPGEARERRAAPTTRP